MGGFNGGDNSTAITEELGVVDAADENSIMDQEVNVASTAGSVHNSACKAAEHSLRSRMAALISSM